MGVEKIRVGVVGCGRVTEARHLPALAETRGAEVVALADTDAARLARVASSFGVARRFTDYREMLRAVELDAVAVCVPPRLHAEVALDALDAGKHLFVEKPLALSLEECDLLMERARASATVVALVGFNMRWHALVREARALLERDGLGRVKLVRTVLTSGVRFGAEFPAWRARREEGGGAIMELGVHHFDLVRFLLGGEAREVFADWTEDETATVAVRMEDGAQVVAAFCEGTVESHEIEIFGERGRLRVSCYRSDGLESFGAGDYPGSARVRLRGLVRTARALPRMLARARGGGEYVATYAAEWRHFVAASKGEDTVGATLEDG
ncbi:MAG TPA: Gfo/Idh/MocA family oxidoreductase, partial [Pyrinomonadaceae bacterium]|nr:Gfo/Idh/MocA family oxidoreductase [Pyrinomonadaceae bacterium]